MWRDFLLDMSVFSQELRFRSVPELQEMGRRLAQGCEHFGATYLELLSVQDELQDELQKNPNDRRDDDTRLERN